MDAMCSDVARSSCLPPSHEGLQIHITELPAANLALGAEAAWENLTLESAIDHAPTTPDLGDRITSRNSRAERMPGYPLVEMLGRSAENFSTPEDYAAGAFIDGLCWAFDEYHAVNEGWHLKQGGSYFWAIGPMASLRDSSEQAQGFPNILQDSTRTHAAKERTALLLIKMQHRADKSFAVVRTLAVHTVCHTGRGEAFNEPFAAGIAALACSYESVSPAKPDEILPSNLIYPCLIFFDGTSNQITITEPVVKLFGKETVSLSLVFHELAAYAAKHGFLSVLQGSVEVRWKWNATRNATVSPIDILWRGQGGPAVTTPIHCDFGPQPIEHRIGQEWGAGDTLQFNFAPEGVTYLMRISCSKAIGHDEQQPHYC